jgi:hypothetical protein
MWKLLSSKTILYFIFTRTTAIIMNDFDFSRIDMIVCDAEPIENGTTIKQMYISNKNGELSMHAVILSRL